MDVLASAAIEQPPLEMPIATAALQLENSVTSDSGPAPVADTDAAATVPFTSTPVSDDMSLLSTDDSVTAPIDMATARFLSDHCCL